jgi:hypothetical protein
VRTLSGCSGSLTEARACWPEFEDSSPINKTGWRLPLCSQFFFWRLGYCCDCAKVCIDAVEENRGAVRPELIPVVWSMFEGEQKYYISFVFVIALLDDHNIWNSLADRADPLDNLWICFKPIKYSVILLKHISDAAKDALAAAVGVEKPCDIFLNHIWS